MKQGNNLVLSLLALVLSVSILSGCGGTNGGDPPGQNTTGVPTEAVGIETAIAQEVENADKNSSTTGAGGFDLLKIDPCTLLTPEEAALFGQIEYDPGRTGVAYEGAIRCNYANMSLTKQIILTVYPHETTEAPKLFVHQEAVPASGFGDEAYEVSDPMLGDGLWVVLKNKALVQLYVPLGKLDAAKALMPKILERLNK